MDPVKSRDSTMAAVEEAWNEMMEADNDSLRERVAALEQKALTQADEIVCLRSTLADVLRRVNLLEGQLTSAGQNPPFRLQPQIQPATPSRNGPMRVSVGPKEAPGVRLRPQSGMRVPSQLPQRSRAVHYQSTGSLHSDSPSSASGGGSPSPSPTHTPQQSASPAPQQSRSSGPTPTPPSPGHRAAALSSLSLAKRWSSTGDFNGSASSPLTSPHSPMAAASRLATKSLFNLYMKPVNPQQQYNHITYKHGVRDAIYNEEEGYVRMFLRGRPVILHAPSDVAPSFEITKVATAPQQRLKLEWVYGYRGRDCRSNVFLLPTGEVVYFIAAAVVLLNIDEQSQRHYLGHTDDVKSLAIHPNKLLVASGQTAGHDRKDGRSWRLNPPPDITAPEADYWPHVRIWNSVSLQTLHVIGIGDFERSICCLSFSKTDGGALLCAIDEAPDHNISVWDWQKGERGHKISETKCSNDTVVAAEWHPVDRGTIVTCGKSHIAFWTHELGGTLIKRNGIFEGREKPKYVTCLAFSQNGEVLSGDSNGNIIVWVRGGNTVSKVVRAVHEGPLFCLVVTNDGQVISGGGKDRRLVQLDHTLSSTGASTQLPDDLGGVRAIAAGRGGRLVVGTTKNSMAAGSLTSGMAAVAIGHTDEVWALAAHPSLPQFATGGHDCCVRLWDGQSRSVVWSSDLPEPLQSAAFSPDGAVLVLGLTTGRWLVLNAETRELMVQLVDGAEPIQVIKFSPDGNLCALGSRDNNIYVYQASEQYKKFERIGRCVPERKRKRSASLLALLGHSSFITHLDWSVDGNFIQSNSGDYELLYWNASTCRQVPQSTQMRNVAWATLSCPLNFNTLGVWPENADGTDVNSCERSHNRKLLATGDDFGKVKLYAYPACQPRSLCHTYSGHSSHVTAVRFLHEDSRLISAGGHDNSIMQWMLC
ncbi:echinoderm microtubule-associated protein-like 2 isoform X2 [Neocloeon triangulifer]|uniref:echinoderm microtubule-associated protein-like 2 isoform X2 n=1 Tax=Neocloeon triangulifer TaxID=2078957 RepID=UPI00286EF58D|nr:echinoderm microtubule-associated protein-like 2 isoform X2 [Neocloeon triangulifer]